MRTIQQLDAEAPIVQASTELYKEFYVYFKTFPKKDQYLLGKRCEDALLSFIKYILSAANLPKDRKLRFLEAANAEFDLLKFLLRVAREMRMIDNKNIFLWDRKFRKSAKCLVGGYGH